ncbi:MAG TPA: hypothetical protein VJR92_06535 [Gemmatimonadaceae bacterium]|nr:hypothetical protein [Gemmatimonadaceae bacterium]
MAINTGKVVAGGLAAGVVMNVIDYVVNTYVLGARFKTAMDAVNPSMSAGMEATSSMVTFIVIDFLIGITVVWMYAAMRPRFGAGAGTAMRAAVLVWFLMGMAWWAWVMAGVMDTTLFAIASVCALINVGLGAYVGAMIYKEE